MVRTCLVLFLVLCVACSSSNNTLPDSGTDSGSGDAGADADFGSPSSTYPAYMPSVPQIVSGGGPVMASVRVVPVFFPNDAQQTKLLDYLTKLAASPTWATQVSEYGVGAISVATPVTITTAPNANVADADIQAFLASSLDGSHAEWGPTDSATLATSVYVLFYPSATTITFGSDTSCNAFRGYHHRTAGGIIYAPIAECAVPQVPDEPLVIAHHELLEAATDPQSDSAPAYRDVDAAHVFWSLVAQGSEVADLCQGVRAGRVLDPSLGYSIPHGWSNASMKGFHDPCLPALPNTPYFVAIPRFDADVPFVTDVDAGTQVTTKGLSLHVGQSATVDVDFLSDGPTGTPWTITADDALQARRGFPQAVSLSIDKSSGENGTKVHLTVTAIATNPYYATVVEIISTLGTTTHTWLGGVLVLP